MTGYSRRQLAGYAADQLAGGRPASNLAKQLAAALVASGRAKQADLLIKDIYLELEDRGVAVHAVVTTARPLSSQLQSEIKAELKKQLKTEKVSIESVLDEDLLGGIKIQTASRQWDDTLSSRLRVLKEVI